jgi:hypothetical protein
LYLTASHVIGGAVDALAVELRLPTNFGVVVGCVWCVRAIHHPYTIFVIVVWIKER